MEFTDSLEPLDTPLSLCLRASRRGEAGVVGDGDSWDVGSEVTTASGPHGGAGSTGWRASAMTDRCRSKQTLDDLAYSLQQVPSIGDLLGPSVPGRKSCKEIRRIAV